MSDLRISVTRELIDRATERDSRRCMIAEAIKEARPDFRNVMVDLQTIRWTNPRTSRRYIVLTPEVAGLALVAFDQGQDIEPFDLILRPSQTTTASVRKPGPPKGAPQLKGQLALTEDERRERTRATGRASKARTNHGRGPRRLKPDGTVEGGRPIRTGHLSNVQVSRNDVRVFGRRLLRG